MDIPSIIDHNYYIVKSTTTNSAWICEAKRFDDRANRLYYYYGTYDLGSYEHKNNCYLSNSYYDIFPNESDEIRLATYEEIEILMDILEKNGIVITLQEAKDKEKASDMKKAKLIRVERFGYKIPDGYEFDTVVDGTIFLKPIKSKYPKTYAECEKILGLEDSIIEGCLGYEYKLLNAFQKLLMCRDAYWKIYGEEMGSDKLWEPDWNELNPKYTITVIEDKLVKHLALTQNYILAFPTEEMRDIFYENFKDLIEQCKELL